MIVKETHPLPIIDRHSCKSVTDGIELEGLAEVERPSDSYICSGQTRVRQHGRRRGTQSSIGSGVIAETGGNVNVATAKRTGL